MTLPTSPQSPSTADHGLAAPSPHLPVPPSPPHPRRLTRALLIGMLLIPLNAFWLVRMEVAGMFGSGGGTAGPYPTSFSLYANAVVRLLLLVGGNRLLARRAPRLALAQPELLVIYVMLVVASSIHS